MFLAPPPNPAAGSATATLSCLETINEQQQARRETDKWTDTWTESNCWWTKTVPSFLSVVYLLKEIKCITPSIFTSSFLFVQTLAKIKGNSWNNSWKKIKGFPKRHKNVGYSYRAICSDECVQCLNFCVSILNVSPPKPSPYHYII